LDYRYLRDSLAPIIVLGVVTSIYLFAGLLKALYIAHGRSRQYIFLPDYLKPFILPHGRDSLTLIIVLGIFCHIYLFAGLLKALYITHGRDSLTPIIVLGVVTVNISFCRTT
jgi:hypothetical protein